MAFTEIDEKLLVRAYQAGDERAFDTIVRTQYHALYAHALRRLSSHESAEDAVQDTMLRAYRALPNLDGDLALRAWLHRILTNVCHDEGNRRRRQHGLVEKIGAQPEEFAADPVEEAVLHDTVRVMSEALKDLPESYREALVLRYVDGLSFREVAEATGVSEENARARVHRGKAALHKIMSRVAIMAAFIIPGLKRTQNVAPGAEHAVASPGLTEQTISLTTQLTNHAVQAAPAVSRLAEMSASMPGGKSTFAVAAVTAVAAVAAPVAYTVNEVRKPEARPSAIAAPAPEFRAEDEQRPEARTVTAGTEVPTSSSSTSTSTSLPASLVRPFEASPGVTVTTMPGKGQPTTTTSTTTPPPVEQGPVLEGHVGGSVLVEGAAPQFDLAGDVTLSVAGKTHTGRIEGRVYLNDDGTTSSDGLALTLDGTTVTLKFRGKATSSTDAAGVVTYQITGGYSLKGGAAFGLAELGDLLGSLRNGEGGAGLLSLDLSGRASS